MLFQVYFSNEIVTANGMIIYSSTPSEKDRMVQLQRQQQQLQLLSQQQQQGHENMGKSLSSMSTSSIKVWPSPYILQRIAVDNTIIVISTNCGYIEMAQNWILHVQKLNITNYLIIAQDNESYQALKSYSPSHYHVILLDNTNSHDGVVVDDYDGEIEAHQQLESTNSSMSSRRNTMVASSSRSTDPSQAYTFRSKGFYEICKSRPYMIQSILQQGYNVIYSDIDLIWVKNVFTKLYNINDKFGRQSGKPKQIRHDRQITTNLNPIDFIGMTEIPGVGDESNPNIVIDDNTKMNHLCSALFFFQPNNPTVNTILSNWKQRMVDDTRNTGEDQTHLLHTLQELYGNYTTYWLNTIEFPPGYMYFDSITKGRKGYSTQTLSKKQKIKNVYAIHANWIKGYDNKIDHLKSINRWLINDDNKLTC